MSDADGADWPPVRDLVLSWEALSDGPPVYVTSDDSTLTVSTTDPAIRAAIIPVFRDASVESTPFVPHWMPRNEPEPVKRPPGEVTNLLDPFNVTDEALDYRRAFGGGPDCRRPIIEALDNHVCWDGDCPGAEDAAFWYADPAQYGYSELDPVFEWETA